MLRFATGSSRLPSDLAAFQFRVTAQQHGVTLQPTAQNGACTCARVPLSLAPPRRPARPVPGAANRPFPAAAAAAAAAAACRTCLSGRAPPCAGLATGVTLAGAATCFNELKLPAAWGSAAELATGMRLTLELGGGFGLA